MSVDSHFFCMSIPPGEVVHPEFIRRAAGEVVSPLAGGALNDYGIVAFSRFFLCIIPNERDFGIGESFLVGGDVQDGIAEDGSFIKGFYNTLSQKLLPEAFGNATSDELTVLVDHCDISPLGITSPLLSTV